MSFQNTYKANPIGISIRFQFEVDDVCYKSSPSCWLNIHLDSKSQRIHLFSLYIPDAQTHLVSNGQV